jgi:arsenate reductase
MKGVLFLCVANSARSQMAEGIARALLPPEVKVWSAGSRPTSVRPEAIAVLGEIGIDISGHRAKAVSEIPAAEVGTVITLCREEECPVFLGQAERLHWGLPDPAGPDPTATRDDVLARFRAVRDELRGRIERWATTAANPRLVGAKVESKIDVRVLGTGCARCKQLLAAAEKAVTASGVSASLAKVERLDEIMEFGVMSTPALVIDGEVKCSGRIPKPAEIGSWLTTAAGKKG